MGNGGLLPQAAQNGTLKGNSQAFVLLILHDSCCKFEQRRKMRGGTVLRALWKSDVNHAWSQNPDKEKRTILLVSQAP